MQWRRCLPLVGALACTGHPSLRDAAANLDAAAAADQGAAAPTTDAAGVEAAVPDPVLTPVMIRPGGERTLHHLDCTINAAGDGMALWRETDFDGKHQVWTTRLPGEGGGWAPA